MSYRYILKYWKTRRVNIVHVNKKGIYCENVANDFCMKIGTQIIEL